MCTVNSTLRYTYVRKSALEQDLQWYIYRYTDDRGGGSTVNVGAWFRTKQGPEF